MRLKLKELTLRRITEGAGRRIGDIPDSLLWRFGKTGENNRQALEQFHNIHEGERCFIMANGPSLAKTDLGPLAGEYTFGMNRIYLLFDQITFQPTYYVCMNELVLEQFRDDIQNLSMPKFLNWNRRSLFESSRQVQYLRALLRIRELFSGDISRHAYSGGTVTHMTLQLAYYMGFQKIYLVGLDHSYAEGGIPSKTEVRTAEKDASHFHPDYFPKGSKWQLPDLPRSELAYAQAEAFTKSNGRKIYDATLNGRCEIFEKVDYGTLF